MPHPPAAPCPRQPRNRLPQLGLLTGILILLAALILLPLTPTRAGGEEPNPPVEPTPLATSWISPDIYKPVLPANPSLADLGAAKYWAVCMACHGDRGQGLTDEWRRTGFGEEDMNCWQSKCHAANHPPEGFSLVRYIPPAIGPTTLQRFTTAQDLHDYLLAKMPWWDPGSLTSDEAWQLTAFLLREDGYYPPDAAFDPRQAASISVHLPYHPRTLDNTGQWLLFGSLGAAALLLMLAAIPRPLLKPAPAPHSDPERSEGEASSASDPAPLPPAPASDPTPLMPTLPTSPPASDPDPSCHCDPERSEGEAIPEPFLSSHPDPERSEGEGSSSPASQEDPSSHSTLLRMTDAHSRPNFLYHLHPPTIPLPQARFRYTLGTGGLAVFLTLLLVVTGALEMFFYIPTPEQAGASIQVITFLVPFGALIRGLHFWAAQALVVVSAIHLLRILFTGAYAPPRRFNFLLGLALFVLALMFDFTGYVLRWDEGIRWALLVGTNLIKTIPLIGAQLYGALIGGLVPGLATITRFYTWHIFALTLLMAVVLVWHLFRVRRDGGISAPPPALRPDPRRITRGELVQREVLAMLIASVVLILVSLLIPAPLAPPIQSGSTPGQALSTTLTEVRAPWFFLWVQQLLRFGDAFWLGVALPLGVLLLLALLPYLFPHLPEAQRGRWFPPAGRAVQLIGALLALGWIILTILELRVKTP